MSFSHLGLSDKVLAAVAATGYTIPTPIQEQAIPLVLARRDVRLQRRDSLFILIAQRLPPSMKFRRYGVRLLTSDRRRHTRHGRLVADFADFEKPNLPPRLRRGVNGYHDAKRTSSCSIGREAWRHIEWKPARGCDKPTSGSRALV